MRSELKRIQADYADDQGDGTITEPPTKRTSVTTRDASSGDQATTSQPTTEATPIMPRGLELDNCIAFHRKHPAASQEEIDKAMGAGLPPTDDDEFRDLP